MQQLTIYDFLNEPIIEPQPPKVKWGAFIIKLKGGKWVIWFRDFVHYNLTPGTKLKDITDAQIFTDDEYDTYDLITGKFSYKSYQKNNYIGYSYNDICTKRYGWYLRHLNVYDYTKRDKFFKAVIDRLKLNTTLNELLEMTIEQFVDYAELESV